MANVNLHQVSSVSPISNSAAMLPQVAGNAYPPRRATSLVPRRVSSRTMDEVTQRGAELSENADWIRLMIDLPGVCARDVEVTVSRGILCVKGCRRMYCMDRSVCPKKIPFQKHFAIDTDVINIQEITSNLTHGVLTIRAPKKAPSQTIFIPVTEIEYEYPEHTDDDDPAAFISQE
jgi:HSP20 family molecular chaperone IbpA